ncbi:MAG: hypothetical protein MJ138_02670 [Kiritimatiellae bacterium]|nr:hypothetical protein [Kiritimatiellia bacterium]
MRANNNGKDVKGMSNCAIEQDLITLGNDAIRELEAKMAYACDRSGVSVADIVGDSYVYVVVGVLKGRVLLPKTVSDLCRLMAFKARQLLKDASRSRMADHGKRSVRARESLDEMVGDSERSVIEYASCENWLNGNRAEERAYQCMIGWKVLDRVFAMRKISSVNQRIYKAVVLHGMPREEVAAQYGTTRNNVDQIVSRVKKGLKEDGLGIYRELYGKAA